MTTVINGGVINSFVIKILSGNKVLISIKSYHFVSKLPKMIVNNTKLDLVNINA